MAETVIPKFWQLTYPLNQRPLERAETPAFEETPCPAGGRDHATLKRIGDLRVIPHPSGLKDFSWTWLSDMLISARTLDLLRRHHITGFEVRTVEAEYPKKTQVSPPELYEVVVTGWAGWAARDAGLSVLRSCPCGETLFTIAHPTRLIDPTAWDGSDMFIVWPLPRFRFITERLANIIRQEKLSGAALLPLEKIRIDPGAEINAGSLLEWMPEERANELRQKFGIY
jgi:hypothetical protein